MKHLDPEERLHPREQLLLADRLGEEIVGTRFDPLHALLRGIERRHHDHGECGGRATAADLAADLVPAHLGHDDVEQDEVGLLRLDLLERLGARGRRDDDIALDGQQIGQQLDVVRGVVDDEDLRRRRHVRSSIARTASRNSFTRIGLDW